MSAYRGDLFGEVRANENFRKVLATTGHTQLVVMTIPPGGEIGEEVHRGIDQVLIAVSGSGASELDGDRQPFGPGDVVVVPAGTRHNFLNTGSEPLRIATVYGPPDHRPGTVHRAKQDADADQADVPPHEG
ncbi:cupin domain-containing protein [Rhizomonospora bruguierae]|uniref:cupin domain-containing protein n=1 Tax=Rhizomonospora bruguierae TaxID=1581705 RepID=UPI001BCB4D6B|nr:cupin domain-containing protein [Micromonospora sp. NBRC 107566]